MSAAHLHATLCEPGIQRYLITEYWFFCENCNFWELCEM